MWEGKGRDGNCRVGWHVGEGRVIYDAIFLTLAASGYRTLWEFNTQHVLDSHRVRDPAVASKEKGRDKGRDLVREGIC